MGAAAPEIKPEAKPALREKLLRTPTDCMLVAENAARTINHGEAAEDDVSAEWKNLCGEDELRRLYALSGKLDSIDANSPELQWELWQTLNRRRMRRSTVYKLQEYHRLIARRATESAPHSIDGKLLKTWFRDGRSAFISELHGSSAGKLHTFAKQDAERRESAMSMLLSANAGAWLPTGNLSRLGNHPTLGFLIGIGLGDWTFNMAMDFRFLNAPADYLYYDPNSRSLQSTSSFFALLLGFDVRWEFLKMGQFSLLAAGALGYDLISHRAAPRYSGLRPAYSDSFNLNGGLVLRYYFSAERAGFVELDARVHKVNYDSTGPGGDDLSGNYFTAVMAAGYRLVFDN